MLDSRGVPSLQSSSDAKIKEPLSMSLELSKSMRWSNDHACFAMFDPLAHDISDMLFLTSFKRPTSFTGYFTNDVRLMFNR